MEDKVIDLIFQEEILKKEPPVLVDLGGAGGIHEVFKKIEQYSTVICVDADKRDFHSANRKNVVTISSIVSDLSREEDDFYLTYSPHCSGRLKPLNEKLSEYAFANLFEVKEKVKVKSTTLTKIIGSNNILTVDWFKTDTQGTDLRLYKSLPDHIREKVIVVEFEPGIIDAYEGEDKLVDVLAYMGNKNYWVDDAVVKGSKRFDKTFLAQHIAAEKLDEYEPLIKDSPGWCEISFINTFDEELMRSRRNLLLGIAFSVLKGQAGFALKLACIGTTTYGDPVFSKVVSIIDSTYSRKDTEDNSSSVSHRIKSKIKKLL